MKSFLLKPACLACALGMASVIAIASPATAQAQEQQGSDASTSASEAAQAIDPARLEAARAVVARLMPDGFYGRAMSDALITHFMGPMANNPNQDVTSAIMVKRLALIADIPTKEAMKIPAASRENAMQILDPDFHERMRRFLDVLEAELNKPAGQIYQQLREVAADNYAREFSLDELQQLETFFNSEAGQHYAEQSFKMVLKLMSVEEIAPLNLQLLKSMYYIGEKLETATAGLATQRKIRDLSDAERERLASLLGVSDSSSLQDIEFPGKLNKADPAVQAELLGLARKQAEDAKKDKGEGNDK